MLPLLFYVTETIFNIIYDSYLGTSEYLHTPIRNCIVFDQNTNFEYIAQLKKKDTWLEMLTAVGYVKKF